MVKYFNTQTNPIIYNDLGQTVDGYGWVTLKKVTPEVNVALDRGDLIKVDPRSKNVYHSNEVPDSIPGDQVEIVSEG